MRRRGFIAGAGVALSAFAGCLGEEQVALSERPPENEVEDAIRTAVGESNTVALQLATAREDAGSPAEIDVDAAGFPSQLDEAQSRLDDFSGSEAAEDYQDEIDAAGAYVDVVEGLIQGSAFLADAAGQLEGLESDLQSGDYDAAGRELEDIQPTVDDSRSAVSEARSAAQSIDAEVLDPYGAKMGELNEGLDAIENLSVGADELATGYDAVLIGQQHLQDGGEAYERRGFTTAESEFQSAGEEFDAATGNFETARAETDGELDRQIDVALCRSGALNEAAGHFETSANAADSDDPATARSEYRAGQDDVEAAENCG